MRPLLKGCTFYIGASFRSVSDLCPEPGGGYPKLKKLVGIVRDRFLEPNFWKKVCWGVLPGCP